MQTILCAVLLASGAAPAVSAADSTWSRAELVAFMRQMVDYVAEHHLRRDDSPMRGKVYEFYLPTTHQPGYGAGWDTMHDGAWFANACLLAYRATNDRRYYELVDRWILPFYLRMLLESDRLFPERERAFSDGQPLPPERAEAGKGFVPYWWDDGHGVNFDCLVQKRTVAELTGPKWGCTDRSPQPNLRDGRLWGYSHGTSNHMALNMFPMLANAWLISRDSRVADAIHELRQSRIHQMHMDLPFLAVADAASHGQAEQAYRAAGAFDQAPWPPETPLYAAMVQKKKTQLTPFLDDPAGRYYAALIGRRVGPSSAKRLTQMAYDCLVLADQWYAPQPRPHGLAYAADSPKQVWVIDGQFTSHAGEIPDVLVGSRMGPQLLWACALSLQLLDAFPDAWSEVYRGRRPEQVQGWSEPPLPKVRQRLRLEVEAGLRFWQEQFRSVGYLRPDWPIGGKKPNSRYWSDQASETGAYAHLISACATYLAWLDGHRDWTLAWECRAPAAGSRP